MGRRPETETQIWLWLGIRGWKTGMKKRKDVIAGVGRGFGGKKPKPAQHTAVNNKQFGVSISIQPRTWKIWISNLAIAFYTLWDAESFYESVSPPVIGWKQIV